MSVWREVEFSGDVRHSGSDDCVDWDELKKTQGNLNVLFIDLHVITMELVTF